MNTGVRMKLSELNVGEHAYISNVGGSGAFRKRIIEMGFIVGKKITVVKMAPLKDPVEYNIMGYNVTIRHKEAEMIEVITDKKLLNANVNFNQPVVENKVIPPSQKKQETEKKINIALVGNPNCGKTTIFNFASNSKERVANYTGVTVAAKEASININNYKINIVDLPGTYSLSSYTPEEMYVIDYLVHQKPHIVVNVIDAANLERNLFLTTQLIDMGVKVIIALNMYDELKENEDTFNHEFLGEMIGIPIVPTIGTKGTGVKDLFNAVIEFFHKQEEVDHYVKINYGSDIENAINKIYARIESSEVKTGLSKRFLAVKLLEGDGFIEKMIASQPNSKSIFEIVEQENKKLSSLYEKDTSSLIVDAKYGFIEGALRETYVAGKSRKKLFTKKADNFLTHRLLGLPVFFAVIWLIFYSTFTLGQYPMGWIESLVDGIAGLIKNYIPQGAFNDFLVDGIIGGVGGVIVFLPNILTLFFFISLMEDTGYMARTAFLMDKAMHKFGLHGKSFIPLLMGFGCNVPAVMSTRTIESKRDRMLTMLVIPFMSCSARLPVYVLFISAFFPAYKSAILFLLYAMGIIAALITAIIFNKTIFKKIDSPFVMELPPYRMPTLKAVSKHMWFKTSFFLKKMGTIILIAATIIWALGYFPRNEKIITNYDNQIAQVSENYEVLLQSVSNNTQKLNQEKKAKINQLEIKKQTENLEQSYISRIGRFAQPVFAPLGFDWKMTVSVLTGVPAKEIVVSSMGVLYQAGADADETSVSLISKLQYQQQTEGIPLITYFGFLVFVLLYFPCFGTIAAIKKETEKFRWMMFTTFYTTTVAWVTTFIIYNIGKLLA